jgi:hypothetical protein
MPFGPISVNWRASRRSIKESRAGVGRVPWFQTPMAVLVIKQAQPLLTW